MQRSLFDREPVVDHDREPFADMHKGARNLVAEFVIDDQEALHLMMTFGAEWAARKALYQRWYNDKVQLRSEAA